MVKYNLKFQNLKFQRDLPSTALVEGTLIKILAWYNNKEVHRMLGLLRYLPNLTI